MKKLVLLVITLIPLWSFCQTDSSEKKGYLHNSEDTMPYYLGGEEARLNFIKNLVYPKKALKEGKQGKVYVKFIVEPDSTVSNVTVVKTFDDDCGEEAARVVKMMNWVPGTQNGKPELVWVVIPVIFKIP